MVHRKTALMLILASLVGIGPLSKGNGFEPTVGEKPIHTFSIVARDPETGAIGIAVASKYLAVGSAVPWAQGGVGGVATQSFVNTTLGPSALALLASGKKARMAIEEVLEKDPQKEWRQVGIVDSLGNSFAFTGNRCLPWAGSRQSKNYSIQGNLLAGPEVLDAMARSFESQPGHLAIRLYQALAAGEKAGGDKRGKQSAAILVVRPHGGPNGLGDREVDLRVDDHPAPIPELGRLLRLKGIAVEP